ncbi:hypothetical protein BMS3Abin02_00205 [bacterium BMS3Abin02]|nr:hypothetical protein BMS3Abin02_00205 [bacterium BMS3Abin02]HDK44800.1 DUF2892 domain-containing protein [Actinomycetota bacterium]HDL48475.1 DUF2892 domain-containing protein [Actinomycetota bacterium]
MKINEASWDRVARVVFGGVLLYPGWANVVTGGWGVFLEIVGFVPLITGVVGWCPIYAVAKFRTKSSA